MVFRFENDINAFTKYVEDVKKIAKGNAPLKNPKCYSSDTIVIGRDGNKWNTCRVSHILNNCEERYELVWIKACSCIRCKIIRRERDYSDDDDDD